MTNFVFFFSKINKFSRYNLKGVIAAVPVGAAGEKFLKFDAFLCIFKAFFRFPPRFGGGTFPLPPPLATPLFVFTFTATSPAVCKDVGKDC